MAHTVASEIRSPANELRKALDQAERLAPQLNGENVERFLTLLDQIQEQFTRLEGEGVDLRPERGRWSGLLGRLQRDPGAVVKAAREAGGLERLRAAHPPAQNPWWRLDAEMARRRRRLFRRLGVGLAILAGILALLVLAFRTVLAPDPQVVLVSNTLTSVEDLAFRGEFRQALDELEAAQAQLDAPDPDLLIWEVVLAEQLQDSERAQAALDQARQILGGQREVLLWSNLSSRRLLVGDLAGARAAAEQAIQLDPEQPQGYFVLGAVAEAEGDIPTAISYFEKTFQLAQERDPQLAVISRVRMGQLLQRLQPSLTPTP